MGRYLVIEYDRRKGLYGVTLPVVQVCETEFDAYDVATARNESNDDENLSYYVKFIPK